MPTQPLYQRLAAELADAIHAGRLPAGGALPSLRECAVERGLSLNTVTGAYRLLEDRGLITARPQSGFYVTGTVAAPTRPLRRSPAALPATGPDALVAQVLAAQQDAANVDLALACPRGPRFYPGERLARHTARVLRRQPGLLATYALPPGSLHLREQIARRIERLGILAQADALVLTHGCMEALQLALRAVTRPGDTVGIEAPAYFNIYSLIASLGLRAVEIPTHPETGLDVDAVERLMATRRIAALVCMPTVHNPLGCTMPVAAKRRLALLAQRHATPVIEDLVYAELQFADLPEPAVKSFDCDGWVLACSGFSKTLAADYRIGWIDAGRFQERVQQLKFVSSGGESALLGEAVAQFLADGSYEHHVRRLRRLYALQVDQMRALVARHFPAGTRITRPAGGFLLWVELPEAVDSLALFHATLAAGAVIIPGQVYSQGARYRHALRISCCREIDEQVVAAVATMGRLARQLG